MDDYLPKPVRPEALQTMLELHAKKGRKASGTTPVAAENPARSNTGSPPELKVLPTPDVVEHPPVDLDRLNEFAGGNVDNFNELVDLYIKQTTDQLSQIQAALNDSDSERASRVAHSCAGASATCGMSAIVPLLRQVEFLGQEQQLSEAAKILPAIQHEFDRLKRYLEKNKPIALAG
jgi:HPt (histidine-containing phosphotransfer) domain-containing protein